MEWEVVNLNIREWYLPHPGWDWEGPSFAQVKTDVIYRDEALHRTKFPGEPLSQKGTSSLFDLKISLSNLATHSFPTIKKQHSNLVSWVWNEKVSEWLDVNVCPDPHTTSISWIEHLSLLGHENPLHWVQHGFIEKTSNWFMKPIDFPLVSIVVCNTSILMSSSS